MQPTPKKKKEVTPWKTSDAKNNLRWDIINGVVNDEMGAREIYNMRPELQVYPYDRFQANLRALRKTIELNIDRALHDSANLYQDLELHPRAELTNRGYPFWDTSEARKLLSRDIKDGLHKRLKPSKLWLTNDEYLKFPLTVFRDHIHQKVRSDAERAYWKMLEDQKKR